MSNRFNIIIGSSKHLIIRVLLIHLYSALGILSFAQEAPLQVEGVIQLDKVENLNSAPGTIQWTGENFQGLDSQSWKTFSSIPLIVTDIDNNTYNVVKIGSQLWMAHDLKVTRYNDGTPIPLVTDQTDWINLNSAAYTWYENAGSPYGALYNGYVVEESNPKNVCPIGWHVPTDLEWTTLTLLLDPTVNPNSSGRISTTAGGKLKETGLENWNMPNKNASNEMGLSIVPGGLRSTSGFSQGGDSSYLWSSTGLSSTSLYYRIFSTEGAWLNRSSLQISFGAGYAIRCIQD